MKPKRRRWPIVVLIILVGIAITLWGVLRFAVAPYLRGKLQAAVTDHFKADLQIDSLRYVFPYGVVAHGLTLKKDGKTLITADSAELSLVELPVHQRPLLIKRVVLDRPTVRYEKIAGDGTAWDGIVKKDAPPTPNTMKLSDLFELRDLTINDGRIEYTDQRVSGSPALVWDHLQTKLNISPQSKALYGFNFSADNGNVAQIAAAGAINIDQLFLDLQNVKVTADANPNSGENPLPPEVQKLLKEMELNGKVTLQASAKIPLKSAADAAGQVSIAINGVRAKLGEAPLAADMQITATRSGANQPIQVSLDRVHLDAGSGKVQIPFASAEINPQQKTWRLTKLDATIEDLTARFGKLDLPFEHLNAKLTTRDNRVVIEAADAYCAADRWTVTHASVPLADWTGGIDILDIAATIDFHQPGPKYAGGFGKTIEAINPTGNVKFSGRYRVNFGGRDRFDLHLTADNSAMALGARKIPVTNVRADIPMTQDGASIKHIEGDLLAGRFEGAGSIGFHEAHAFEGRIQFENLEMDAMTKAMIIKERDKPYGGKVTSNITLRGEGADPAKFQAAGDVQVLNGWLFEFPVLGGIASKTKVKKDALTATEAAAIFEVEDSVIHLRRAALNSDALGLEGRGKVGFDGQLDLQVVAAPFGDWRDKIKETRIPILSDVVGEVAGGLQKVINTATQELLYEFRVTGDAAKPEIKTIPTPILSDAGAALFGTMLKPGARVIDSIREPKPASEKKDAPKPEARVTPRGSTNAVPAR